MSQNKEKENILGKFSRRGCVVWDAGEACRVALVPAPLEIAFVLVGIGRGGKGLELADKGLPHGLLLEISLFLVLMCDVFLK